MWAQQSETAKLCAVGHLKPGDKKQKKKKKEKRRKKERKKERNKTKGDCDAEERN